MHEVIDMYPGSITDVTGVLVGHASDTEARTGATAVIFENGAVAGVDVRGGGPGTRETDAMAPGRLVEKIDAIMLAGGSAFGLDAAGGAMRWLEEHGHGFDTGFGRVPIVGSAVIFDLACGSSAVRPDAEMGYAACAGAGKACLQGSVGAGTGATVGKLLPGHAPVKCGVGTASLRLPSGAVLGALAVVNAAGDVFDPDSGEMLAGVRSLDSLLADDAQATGGFPGNTTVGVIATDARLTHEQAHRLALLAHDGYARAIRPVHLPVDGDTVFAASTGDIEESYMRICSVAAEVMARAIANAALATRGESA